MLKSIYTFCCFSYHDFLSISHQDLPEISVSHSNLTVIEGDRVTITCNGSGVPVPEVDWTVGGLHSINTHQVRQTFACSILTSNQHAFYVPFKDISQGRWHI